MADHLSGLAAGEFLGLEEDDTPRTFVPRQPLARVGDELLPADALAAHGDARPRRLAPTGIASLDDHRLDHRRVGSQDSLQLGWVNALAPALDHVPAAIE